MLPTLVTAPPAVSCQAQVLLQEKLLFADHDTLFLLAEAETEMIQTKKTRVFEVCDH